MKLLRDEKNRGYTPMLDEILDPENQVNGNLLTPTCVASWCLKFTFTSHQHRTQTSLQVGFLTIDTILGDYKEGYYIGVEVPADDPQSKRPFFGPNQWPSEGKLSLFHVFFY
jgi:isopenicillin N synthase-like dioxygenase